MTQALIQLYARITKLGWFDCQKEDYVFRNVIVDVTRFLQVWLILLDGSSNVGRFHKLNSLELALMTSELTFLGYIDYVYMHSIFGIWSQKQGSDAGLFQFARQSNYANKEPPDRS